MGALKHKKPLHHTKHIVSHIKDIKVPSIIKDNKDKVKDVGVTVIAVRHPVIAEVVDIALDFKQNHKKVDAAKETAE